MRRAEWTSARAGKGRAVEQIEPAIDARSRQLTEAGNRALTSGDGLAASRFYDEALTEAERLFQLALTDGGPPVLFAPMTHNIACHNAAEAMKRSGDDGAAHEVKLRALQKLVSVAVSPASPLALRVNCVRHLKYALASLARDVTEDKARMDDTTILVEHAQKVAAEVFRIAGHAMACERDDDGVRPRGLRRMGQNKPS